MVKQLLKIILKKLKLYNIVKNKMEKIRKKRKLTKRYKFEDRKKDKEKVCFVLAGYKEFLYDSIFNRIKYFIPNDIEVCILSSGKYSTKLSRIAKENDWSYLSTKKNNVALIQNVGVELFKNAKYIYKLDEDIFVTKNYFETLFKTLEDCQERGEYKVGFVAPTIPINGFGNMLILKRFSLIQTYEEKFERPIYAAGRDRMVESNPEVAKFFWGEGEFLPDIDTMNETVGKDKFEYIACPIRFSIGAILFTRKFWSEMGMFDVVNGSGMGSDEKQICSYCMTSSKAIIVSKNSIVGHLSFGKQNETMKKYFLNKKIRGIE